MAWRKVGVRNGINVTDEKEKVTDNQTRDTRAFNHYIFIRMNPPATLWELIYRQTQIQTQYLTQINSTSYNRTTSTASHITFHGRWTGLIWLRIETDDGLLWKRYWIFGFHKLQHISWLGEELLPSQKWLYAPWS